MIDDAFLSTYILLGGIIVFSVIGFRDRHFMEKYLYSPYDIKHYGQWYRWFTHAFLHADLAHLFFNGFTLFSFGPVLIVLLKTYSNMNAQIFFWFLVVSSMIISSSISYFRHKDDPGYRSLGFSGVTSAIVFGFIVLAPTYPLEFMFVPVPIPAWLFGLIFLGFEIYADRQKKTNIAHDAHIAGAIYGAVIIFLTNIDVVLSNFNL